MNDSSEATHYQIELTSRQVLAGLVVLLVCLFAAFFAGVVIGRNAEASSAASELASVDEVARGGERYDFFSRTEGQQAAGGSGAGAAADEDSSLDDFPAQTTPLEGDFGPDAEDAELAPTEGDRSTMAGADPDALFEDDAAAGDADLPPPEEMGRGGRRRRAAARAEEEALAATANDPELPDDDAAVAPAASDAGAAANARPAAAGEQPPSTPMGQGFHIQVLATSDRAKAEALVSRLADADFKAFLVPSNEGGRTVYRVRVGPFPDRAIATGAAKELETRWGLDSWISPGAP